MAVVQAMGVTNVPWDIKPINTLSGEGSENYETSLGGGGGIASHNTAVSGLIEWNDARFCLKHSR